MIPGITGRYGHTNDPVVTWGLNLSTTDTLRCNRTPQIRMG